MRRRESRGNTGAGTGGEEGGESGRTRTSGVVWLGWPKHTCECENNNLLDAERLCACSDVSDEQVFSFDILNLL